ncbi:MAG: efflux RND transporter periplasmic adaptor subunit [Phycisphaeraceae bacterium]|nr:efflux RND transporter periplasmic adaptor subunit [Phycisphaeraceae bacterium]
MIRSNSMLRPCASLLALTVSIVSGCDRSKPPPAATPTEEVPAITNRVEIGATVRRNLGITFARVELRPVAQTLRLPARVELPPSAHREERSPASGVVELLVSEFEPIRAGEALFRIDSPQWRELQQQLSETFTAIRLSETEVASIAPLMLAHRHHEEGLHETIALRAARVEQLEHLVAAGGAPGGELSEARAQLARAKVELAETGEKEAALEARNRDAEAKLDAARTRAVLLLSAAAAITAVPVSDLERLDDGQPRWQRIDRLERRSAIDGIVAKIHAISGGQVEALAPVLEVVDPSQVQVRAALLQGDLARLPAHPTAVAIPAGSVRDSGRSASAVTTGAATASSVAATSIGSGALASETTGAAPMHGTLFIAPVADSDRRTIDLVLRPIEGTRPPAWARPGVSALLEVTVDGDARPELAIPLRAVVRDGAKALLFRRDPRNPDRAIRLDADLGIDDGRWIVIRSGVREGDEVVLDGAYQLMVDSSGAIPKGGHFHADGTWHADH